MSITQEKIAVYRKYVGDIDGWARMASVEEKRVMSDDAWHQIDGLIQDYALVKGGLASARFAAKLQERIAASTPDTATAEALEILIEHFA